MEEESNSSEPKEIDASKPSRKPKVRLDLLNHIYNRPEYTAVVRAIGTEAWEIEDGRDLVIPLMKRFGVQRVRDATEELLAIDVTGKQTIVHLTDDVRRYAVSLFGNTAIAADDAAPPMASELPRTRLQRLKYIEANTDAAAKDYVPADKKRAHVVERFASHLHLAGVRFQSVKDIEFLGCLEQCPIIFDFLIERGAERQIAFVRREIALTTRRRLQRFLNRLGPDYIAVRVWPIGAEKVWFWEKEWILPGDAPPEAHNAEAKAKPMSGPQAEVLPKTLPPRPTVQRELF